MTYVVTEPCILCKYTDCVEVCPIDAFREGSNFLAIDPHECIDCSLCVAECPVEAIFAENDLPEDQVIFIQINIDLAGDWTVIQRPKLPLSDAAHWATVSDKLVRTLARSKKLFEHATRPNCLRKRAARISKILC
jgi:ferredoxin